MPDHRDYIYDMEVFPNVTTLAAKHHISGTRYTYEISHRRNDRQALCLFLQWLRDNKCRMVGYNNVGFDYPVLHYIMQFPDCIAIDIYRKAMTLIDSEDKFGEVIWQPEVEQIDLYKLHDFDRVTKFTSLKAISINKRSEQVIDLPFPPGTILSDADIDDVLIPYNHHDVDDTDDLYVMSEEQIKFREELTTENGGNWMNYNDPKIGKEYFIQELERAAPGSCFQPGTRKPRQTFRPNINLGDAIFPWFTFQHSEFQRVYDWLRSQVIVDTKGIFKDLSCTIDGFQFDFGTGGIHGSVSSRAVYADEEHYLTDFDVASFYPNIAIVNKLFPLHLGEDFCRIYEDVYQQRKKYAKGSARNQGMKLSLNAVYGQSNNAYSPFFDPQYTMSITINGQLLLCLLADYLMFIPGLEMIQINTDGLTVRYPKGQRWIIDQIAEWWQQHTRLELESVEYRAMWIRDVNSYIAQTADGKKTKRKGAYAHVFNPPKIDKGSGDLEWHQDHSALVVPKAAEAALVRGEDLAAFIFNHTDPFDFMLRAKVPRNCQLVLGEQPMQKITRYYVAREGGSLTKIMPPLAKNPDKERRISICAGRLVRECNDARTFDRSLVDFDYYIKEAEKLVKPLLGR